MNFDYLKRKEKKKSAFKEENLLNLNLICSTRDRIFV